MGSETMKNGKKAKQEEPRNQPQEIRNAENAKLVGLSQNGETHIACEPSVTSSGAVRIPPGSPFIIESYK